MLSIRIIVPLFLLLGFSNIVLTAHPSLAIRQERPPTYLKTRVLEGDPTKDGLYVQAYHTGAASNDATLTRNVSEASRAFLNDTYLQFDLGSTFPWGLTLAYNQYYTHWLDVEIDVGYGSGGFALDQSGLISNNSEWRGWLVCDWYHLVPQLFWRYYYNDFPLPCNCAHVELCLEAA